MVHSGNENKSSGRSPQNLSPQQSSGGSCGGGESNNSSRYSNAFLGTRNEYEKVNYDNRRTGTLPTAVERKVDKLDRFLSDAAAANQKLSQENSETKNNPPLFMIRRESKSELCRVGGCHLIQKSCAKLLWKIARFIIYFPVLFIVIPIFISVICCSGFVARRNALIPAAPFAFYYYNGQAPTSDSQGTRFNESNPRYESLEKMAPNEYAIVVSAASGGSILNEDIMNQYLGLKFQVEDIGVPFERTTLKYAQLCDRSQVSCGTDVVQEILNADKSMKFAYPNLIDQNRNITLFLGNTFGGVETNDDGDMASAKALMMHFNVKMPANKPDLLDDWYSKFVKVVQGATGSNNAFRIRWWSNKLFNAEVGQQMSDIFGCLIYSVLIFAALTLLSYFTTNRYTSKPWLSFSAIISIVLSILSAVGAQLGITGALIGDIFPQLFAMAATASFCFHEWLQSWRKLSESLVNPAEKFRVVLATEGPSFLFVCLMGIVAFGLASLGSKVPMIQYSCQLNATFLFIFLLFGLCLYGCSLYLTGKREASKVPWYLCCSKGADDFPGTLNRNYKTREIHDLQRKLYSESSSNTSFSRKIGIVLSKPAAICIIVLLFLLYLIFAIWGCTTLKIGVNESDYLLRNGRSSYSKEFLDNYDKYYGGYDKFIELVFTESINYDRPDTRAAINHIFNWVESRGYSSKITSWLREFDSFSKNSIYHVTSDTLAAVIRMVFLRQAEFQRFKADLVIDESHEEISMSRMYIELTPSGIENQLSIVKHLMSLAKAGNLPLQTKSAGHFLMEHDVQIQDATWATILIFIAVFAALSLLLTAQPIVSLILLVITGSITIGTLGISALFGVTLNAMTVSTIVSLLVFSSSMVLSFCYHFINNNFANSSHRMQYAFHSTFLPALITVFVIVLSCLPLLVTNNRLAFDAIVVLFCHIVLSLLHTFIFVPPCIMVLSLNFKEWCNKSSRGNKNVFGRRCCCGPEEEASSIYFIPTLAKAMTNEEEKRFTETMIGTLPRFQPPQTPMHQSIPDVGMVTPGRLAAVDLIPPASASVPYYDIPNNLSRPTTPAGGYEHNAYFRSPVPDGLCAPRLFSAHNLPYDGINSPPKYVKSAYSPPKSDRKENRGHNTISHSIKRSKSTPRPEQQGYFSDNEKSRDYLDKSSEESGKKLTKDNKLPRSKSSDRERREHASRSKAAEPRSRISIVSVKSNEQSTVTSESGTSSSEEGSVYIVEKRPNGTQKMKKVKKATRLQDDNKGGSKGYYRGSHNHHNQWDQRESHSVDPYHLAEMIVAERMAYGPPSAAPPLMFGSMPGPPMLAPAGNDWRRWRAAATGPPPHAYPEPIPMPPPAGIGMEMGVSPFGHSTNFSLGRPGRASVHPVHSMNRRPYVGAASLFNDMPSLQQDWHARFQYKAPMY